VGKQTTREELRSAAAVLDALEVGVVALDGRSRPVVLNRKAQDLLGCQPAESSLPRPVLDLGDQVWRSNTSRSREIALGELMLRLHATPLQGCVLIQVHDVTLLRHLQQAHRDLVAAMSDALLERVEGPALLMEALAWVDDPGVTTQWLGHLRGNLAELARLVSRPSAQPSGPLSPSLAASSDLRREQPTPPATATWYGRDLDGRPTLLLVEPISAVAAALTVGLSNAGLNTVVAASAQAALEVLKVAEPDCVVVDLGHGDAIAAAAAQRLRRATLVPMVVLTGRDAEPPLSPETTPAAPATIVVQRPMRLHELIAAAKQALSKAGTDPFEGADGIVKAGDVSLDTHAHTVWVRGQRVAFSPKERQLLRTLLLHPGRVLSSERLIELAWGDNTTAATLSTYLGRLRGKIERDPSHPQYIRTVRGIGFRFEVPGTDPNDNRT
jgi:two-component system response regulator RegX3